MERDDAYNGKLTHISSGFSVSVDNFEYPHGVIKDPRRQEYESRLSVAKTIQDYESIKSDMNRQIFRDTPAMDIFEALFLELPTCEELYRQFEKK